MRGYPKHVATKQDFLNLLSMDEYRGQATENLIAIFKMNDEKANRHISGSEETKDLKIEEIENSMPLWKRKGFKSRQEIAGIIKKHGGCI